MERLIGKIAIVTGASRGIGKAIAIAFAQEGANLVIASRDAQALKKTEAAIIAKGVAVEVVPTDVTSEQQIDMMFTRTLERFGKLDVLVNNAGIFENGPIDQLSTDVWDRVIAVNLRAPFLCTRAAFRIMKQQGGGRIINIGSISAQRVRIHNTPYNCSKFGLVGLTHTTALEGRDFGITCGCLHPGVTRDQRNRTKANEDVSPSMSLEELAAAAVFMASQPPHVNVLELIQLPRDQPYLGRG